MASKDSRIDAYIEKAAPFARPILKHLRNIVHAGCPNVQETIKWQSPHFDHKGPMCGMAAFKNHCAFGFWKAELILGGEKRAQNEAMGHFGRITSVADLPVTKTFVGYVRRAVELNDAGTKAPWQTKRKKKKPLTVPDYFTAALRKNPKARKTFEEFSPSQRREYVEWISEAKREETREQRLATSMKWLGQGKPRNWKYMPKR